MIGPIVLSITALIAPIKGTVTQDSMTHSASLNNFERVQVDFIQTSGGKAGSGLYKMNIPQDLKVDVSKFIVGSRPRGSIYFTVNGISRRGEMAVGTLNTVKFMVSKDGNEPITKESSKVWGSKNLSFVNPLEIHGWFDVPVLP